MSLRPLQHHGPDGTRSVIAAQGEVAHFLGSIESIRALAELATGRLLAPIDHDDSAHMLLTGTGFTHLGSAGGRDQMHKAAAASDAFEIEAAPFTLPLRNPLARAAQVLVAVKAL